MRKVLIGFGILLTLLAGGIFWAISSADDVLHAAIEETGSAALATEVRLEGADVDLIAGRITLTGLEVANPSGFGAGPAIDAGRLDIVMAREASDDRTLVLSRVLIDAPRLAYEVRGGAANLAALRDAAEAYTSGAAASDSPVDATEGLPALRVIVRELVVRDARAMPADAGSTSGREVALDDLRLADLGGDAGAPVAALLPPLLDAMLTAVERTVGTGGEG